ncbi:GntR family transcriptional regulator [Pigmentiphaga soli]|uniref:GntR family transcriptional regulator n=1 Tax=Pigmentiphaga soli TaxID=1007095 RepID=A0ABP8H6B7_9BURK
MRLGTAPARRQSPATLANSVYVQLKRDIFDFRLVPGDRFSETEIAERLRVSRTPVREALYRLQHEGYLEVHFRSGWSVRPFDFEQFDQLYDLRTILEAAALRRLCARGGTLPAGLRADWLVAPEQRQTDGRRVAELDEAFHRALVEQGGNPELTRVYDEVTDRIRILRQLDFTQPVRIARTYEEHGRILLAALDGRADEAVELLSAHIEASKAAVHRITLHRLYAIRQANR